MKVLDLFKKDDTPRAYRAAIKTFGVNNVKQTTLNGARQYLIKDVRERKVDGRSTDPALMIQNYKAIRDPEWDAMCAKVGVTDTDIYNLMVEVVAQLQDDTGQVQALKVGRNTQCPCGSGKKYKRCCGA